MRPGVPALLRLARGVETFIGAVGRVVAWLTLAMVLLVAGNTLLRYFFSISAIWAQELEWHVLALIALWGIAYTQLFGEHVRVDMFHQKMSKRAQLWLEFATALFVMLPFSAYVAWLGIRFVSHSYGLAEVSPDPGGLTHRWIVKSFVVSGYALLAIASVSVLIRTAIRLVCPARAVDAR